LKTNNTTSNFIGQALYANSSEILENTLSLIAHYKQHSLLRLHLMGKFISYNLTMDTLEMSQDYLADEISACDRTVRRGIEDLKHEKLLKKRFRFKGKGREQTNLYTLHPFMKTREFLEALAPHFHEIDLYCRRTFRPIITKTVQTVKCALSAIFNGGALLFNYPSLRSSFNVTKQVNSRACVREEPAKNSHRKEVPPSAAGEPPKRRSMEEYLLRPLVKKISRKLNLTVAGSIGIAAYPDEVLQMALGRIEKSTVLNKPFYGFVSICSYICKDLGMRRDTCLMFQMQDKYNISDDAPKTKATAQVIGVRAVSILDVGFESVLMNPPIAPAPLIAKPSKINNAAPVDVEKSLMSLSRLFPEDVMQKIRGIMCKQ